LQRNAPPFAAASAITLGEAMIKGKASRLLTQSHLPMLLLLVCSLPAASGAEKPLPQAPPPTASQQLLIEIHGLTGVGWWSPPTREIEDAAPPQDTAGHLRADA
jgi:hypothetical protein